MRNNFFISYRLIKSKKNSFFSLTTNIAILGIAISVAILILSVQILRGFENTIFSYASRIDSQIKVTGFGDKNLNDDAETEQKIKQALGNRIEAVEKFLSKYVVLKSKLNGDGATLIGAQGNLTKKNLEKFIVAGKAFNKNEITVGKILAEKLGVKPGDKITVFALNKDKIPDANNPPNIMQFVVSGIFESGMPYYDNSFAFIDFNSAKRLFGLENKISGYNIYLRTSEEEKIEDSAKKLRNELPYPYYARSIFSIHRNIFVWLELQKKPIPIVLSAIVLVAMLNIIGALFLLVLRRKKTIGILRTLGFVQANIGKIFLFQGAFISSLGILTGAFLAYILTFLQNNFEIVKLPGNIYFLDKLIISYDPVYYFVITAGAFAVGVAVSVLPAKFASKISPINAIKNL